MSAELNRDSEDQHSSESPVHHTVDGAIVHAKSRLSLLKNQLANLSYDIMRSTDLDGAERGQNKAINRSMDVQSSPRSSSVFSGDVPETTPGNKAHERPVYPPSSRGESIELESQWRGSEAETFSDDHDHYQPMNEIHDGSSCSSRSWSLGKPIGFGVSATDQMLLRNLTRATSTRRRYDNNSFPTEVPVETKPPRRKEEDDALSWVLNSLLPYSCWPKDEAMTEPRVPGGRDGSFRNSSSGVRGNKINQSVRVPLLSHAVRSAIGKMWDDSSFEMAQDIWQLITEFLSNEDEGRLDPECCWVTGRSVSVASDGLPFAFTIHTFSSICKPCTYGHANVLAEITSLDHQSSGDRRKTRDEPEHRVYGNLSPESYSLPEPLSPSSQLPWERNTQSSTPSSPAKESSKLPPHTREAGSESLSTFSFNSVNQRVEKGEAPPGSASTETLSTADLTAFIRVGDEPVSRPRHRGHLQAVQRPPEDSGPSSSDRQSTNQEQDSQPGTFSEQDLIWEMHYPDLTKLETVIASRRLKTNDRSETKRTYVGDTDSEEDGEKEPEQLEEIFRAESPTGTELMHNDSQALVPYNDENNDATVSPFRSQLLDSDPWSDVATASSRNGYLTQSMEVNLGEEDDDEAGKRWGRIRKLSSLVRRVKKMIGNNVVDGRKLIDPLPTIHDGQELEESDGEELSGYYTCETPSPTAMQRAHSITPSPSPDHHKRLSSQQPLSPDVSVIMSREYDDDITHDRHASVDSASGALSERNLMLAPQSSLASSHLDSVQNVTWEESKSFNLPIKDLGNGQYLALGHLTGVGKYKLTVKIGKKQVHSVPKAITVVDPRKLGSGIGEDGPFFQRPDSPVFPSASTMLTPHPDFPPCHAVTYDPDRLEYAQKHSHIGHVEMLFVVDCTSSMGSELRQLPSVVERIVELMKETLLCKRLRLGVIAYRDHHPEDEDNFLLRKQDFTDNIDRVKNFIAGLEADGGDDFPEAMEVALEEAADGVQWSLFSSKFVLWIGDAPPHGYQGFRHKEALAEEKKFKDAKARLKKAAYAVDVAMMNEASPRQLSHHDRDLADALSACDAIGKFHDKYPLGIPGRVRWEEAIERLSAIGARVLALGLRSAVTHPASSSCLRTIAHTSGGALLEVSSLEASVIGPLTVAIVEQSLDQQLIDEEVCDLILCFKNDFEQQSYEDRRRSVVESMSQAAKQPHRLQVHSNHLALQGQNGVGTASQSETVSAGLLRPDSRSTAAPSTGSVGPLSISRGSFDLSGSRDLTVSGETRPDDRALLLGMMALRFDDGVLEQVLQSLRNKAEKISRCLISNFESPEQWFEFHTRQPSDGLYRRERNNVSELTAPLSLRCIVATHIMAVDRS